VRKDEAKIDILYLIFIPLNFPRGNPICNCSSGEF